MCDPDLGFIQKGVCFGAVGFVAVTGGVVVGGRELWNALTPGTEISIRLPDGNEMPARATSK